MRAGASGFLLKDVSPEQLVAAVRLVRSGQALFSPAITERLVATYTSRRPGADHVALRGLSEREVEVFDLMARGRSNAEIAETLFLAETTVKSHVGHILTKLNLRDRVQAVIYGYEHGLI